MAVGIAACVQFNLITSYFGTSGLRCVQYFPCFAKHCTLSRVLQSQSNSFLRSLFPLRRSKISEIFGALLEFTITNIRCGVALFQRRIIFIGKCKMGRDVQYFIVPGAAVKYKLLA